MTQIICVANQKGGVGKSTTVVTIGHGFARLGYKVLLVDLDSQGNVADSLGMESGRDLYELMLPFATNPPLPAVPLPDVATPSGRDNLDVIRSDKYTAALKTTLAGTVKREYILAKSLKDSDYDIILLDCAPSVDLMQTNALVAAHFLLIPTRLDQLALKGVRDVMQTLAFLQQEEMTKCQLAGILPTFYDRVTRESYQQLVHLAQTFKQMVWPPVPLDTKCRVATRRGQTLWEYAPHTRALQGYENGSGGKTVGGYTQVMDRIKELIK